MYVFAWILLSSVMCIIIYIFNFISYYYCNCEIIDLWTKSSLYYFTMYKKVIVCVLFLFTKNSINLVAYFTFTRFTLTPNFKKVK